MKQSYQHGYLQRTKRKNGPDKWEFLWREIDDRGDRIRRTAIIGDIEKYPTEECSAQVGGRRRIERLCQHLAPHAARGARWSKEARPDHC